MTRKAGGFDRQRTVILLALAAGSSRQAAASEAGISDRTLRRWVADDPRFAESVEVAQGNGRAIYERLIREHGEKDWRAALALYELIYIGIGRRGGVVDEPLPTPTTSGSEPRSDEDITQQVGRAVETFGRLLDAYGGDTGRVQALLERNERLKDMRP